MRRLLQVAALAALAVAVNAVLRALPLAPWGEPPPAAERSASDVEPELEQLLLQRINRIRQERSLPRLTPDSGLTEAARRHSRDMIRNGFFDHQNQNGENSSDRVAKDHRRLFGLVGENLWGGSEYDFLDPSSLADRIADDLMKSSGHRENILESDYTHLGVGALVDGGEIRVTQVFARVEGLLRSDLPQHVRPGEPLDLRMASPGRNAAPVHFDLESLDRRQVLGPYPVRSAAAPSKPGRYRLRLYFPTEQPQVLKVVYGPAFEVR